MVSNLEKNIMRESEWTSNFQRKKQRCKVIKTKKKIVTLHQKKQLEEAKKKTQCKLTTPCRREVVVQRKSYMKEEKRDPPKREVDNGQKTIMKNVAAATR